MSVRGGTPIERYDGTSMRRLFLNRYEDQDYTHGIWIIRAVHWAKLISNPMRLQVQNGKIRNNLKMFSVRPFNFCVPVRKSLVRPRIWIELSGHARLFFCSFCENSPGNCYGVAS